MSLYQVIQDSPVNRDRKKIAKAVRSAVRLHFSMMADDYINDVLPTIMEQHEAAVVEGKPFILALNDLPALPQPEDLGL